MMTRNDCARWLRDQDNYCILTHRRPDGDAMGSAAALCLGLRKLGKTAWVLENPDLTARFAPLVAALSKAEAGETDTVISVDVASPGMLPKAFAHLAQRTALRIDHHGSATSFTELELVDPGAGACAEIILDLLEILEVSLDPAIAEAVYVGTSTDTGCFRFANTTAHTFRTAAACAAAGADIYRLNQQLFETNTLSKLRIQAWIVENIRLFGDGKLAICPIPKAVEEALGVTEDDMDNISSFPRTIEGVCMAATLRENKDGTVKISVRAIPGYDAAAVCEHFGGGGHKGAAGGSTPLPLEAAAQKLEQIMAEQKK